MSITRLCRKCVYRMGIMSYMGKWPIDQQVMRCTCKDRSPVVYIKEQSCEHYVEKIVNER